MKNFYIDYAKIDPITLECRVERMFPGSLCRFSDVTEDFFELCVYFCNDLDGLEDLIAEYL